MTWLYEAEILSAVKGAGLIRKFLFSSDFPSLDSLRYAKIFTASGLSDDHLEIVIRACYMKN